MNGNVGIGTRAPALPFSVTGDSYHNGNVGIGTSITTAGAALSVMNGNVGIGTWAPNGALIVNGNVGIGTTTASTLFVARGQGPVAAAAPNFFVVDGQTFAGTAMAGRGGSILLTAGSVTGGLGTAGGAITLTGGNSGNNNGPGGNITLTAGSPGNVSQGAGEVIINPGIAGTNPYVALATTGGNVGIGTTSLGSLLSVLGGAGFGSYATSTAPAGGIIASGNVGIGTLTANSALQVVGNVGIGSVAPAGSLDVSPTGTICFGSSCKTSWAGIGTNYWSLAGGTGNVGISTTNTVGIGTTSGVGAGLVVMNGNVGIGTWVPGYSLGINGNLGIGTVGPGGNFVVTSTGNVGIGTTNPLAELNLNAGGTSNQDTLILGNNTTRGINLVDIYGRLDMYTYGTDLVFNYFGGQNSVFHDKVEVGDQAYSGNAQLEVDPSATSEIGQIIKGFAGQTADLFQAQKSAGTVLVNITSIGNVGIGTTAPAGALTVMNGNVGIGTWVPGSALKWLAMWGLAP